MAEEKRNLEHDLKRWEQVLKDLPAPWFWGGNTGMNHLYLATQGHGRIIVMDFDRYGMHGAAPRFQINHVMRRADNFVQYEVDYRKDVIGINHPVAQLMEDMAEAWPHAIRRAMEAEDEIEKVRAKLQKEKLRSSRLMDLLDRAKLACHCPDNTSFPCPDCDNCEVLRLPIDIAKEKGRGEDAST